MTHVFIALVLAAILWQSEACLDSPVGWKDTNEDSCSDYWESGWCTADGRYGANWDIEWGNFSDYGFSGVGADQACCLCGGGGGPELGSYLEDRYSRSDMSNATILDLSGLGLTGSIPQWIWMFSSLRYIDLSNNMLSGSIPAGLGKLVQLEQLILHQNHLSGSIPAELGQLINLQKLDLDSNKLSGSIHTELGQLVKLEELFLCCNQLSGSIPAELGRLVGLQQLTLHSNQLSESIPADLGKLVQLEELSLHSNQLSGSIPAKLGQLVKLQKLDLSLNKLSGSILAELGQLVELEELYLEFNQVSGSIPAELGKLVQLEVLSLHSNQLSDSIPAELDQLVNLEKLFLHSNQLSGNIPARLGRLVELQQLTLHSNQLSGSIPAELGKLVQLEFLSLQSNQLSGSIPAELGKLVQLKKLFLRSNQLSGSLPTELGKLVELQRLDLSSNKLSGRILAKLGQLVQLEVLSLHSNQLSGSIPAELGQLVELKELDLASNQLSGSIPADLGKLMQLEALSLHSNQLSGSIPAELGQLVQLEKLFLHYNQLSGSIPDKLGQLVELEELYLQSNQLSGSIPSSFVNMSKMVILNAASNLLSGAGSVPSSLKILNVSVNVLSRLPNSWWDLPNLETLLLRDNRLSSWPLAGVLPQTAFTAASLNCGFRPKVGRFKYPRLRTIDISRNPLTFDPAVDAHALIYSLGYLPELRTLLASGCGLGGEISVLSHYSNTGNNNCMGVPRSYQALESLIKLDLSNNSITAFAAPPPPNLLMADLSNNKLGAGATGHSGEPLHRDWWNEAASGLLSRLNVQSNSALHVAVAAPTVRTCNLLPQPHMLSPDALSFKPTSNAISFECTILCNPPGVAYEVDAGSLNTSSLCRCLPGYEGISQSCKACEEDTFSYSPPNDTFQMVKTCRQCPSGSSTEGGTRQLSVCSCKCQAGMYMSGFLACGQPMQTIDPEMFVCIACPPGEYAAVAGSTACVQCAAGTASSANGSTACTSCPPGFMSDTRGATACKACPGGRFQQFKGQSECHQECEAGTYSPRASPTCIKCSGYNFSDAAGATTCRRCGTMFMRVGQDNTSCQINGFILLLRLLAACALCIALSVTVTGVGLRRKSKFAWTLTGKAHLVSDLWADGGQVFLRTAKNHGLYNRFSELFPIQIEGAAGYIDGNTFCARVVDNRDLEIFGKDGSSLLAGSCEASMGVVRLPMIHSLLRSGWPLPHAVLVPLISMLAAFLTLYDLAQILEVFLVIALSFVQLLLVVFWMLASPTTRPLDKVLKAFSEKLKETNSKPTPTIPGPDRSITLGKLVDFGQYFKEFIRDRNMYYLEPNIVRPITTEAQLSFSDMLGSSRVQWFVSHYWGHPFQGTLAALRKHAIAVAQKYDWSNIAYWICTFSNNQHKLHEEIPETLEGSSFYKTLHSGFCDGVCLVLDEDATPLTRSWCLFEFLLTVKLKESAEFNHFIGCVLCHSSGVLDYGTASVDVSLGLGRRLANLRLEDAGASRKRDKDMIDNRVVSTLGSFEQINLELRHEIESAMQSSKRCADEQFDSLISILHESRGIRLRTRLPL